MKKVTIHGKQFILSIPSQEIQKSVSRMASQINNEMKGKDVIFFGILNGSFMFAADLYKQINFDSQISFLKLASYQGNTSSGKVKRLIGINEDINNKTVIILEDIVDTGITMENITKQLKGYEPAEIKTATLLFKPEACEKRVQLDYIGFEIPNEFIVGYGLDYDGYGRNLKDIYKIANE
jgi:hypoxanthine phosphoribosyltransferase